MTVVSTAAGTAGFDFRDRRVLVTGASRGIGRAVAEAFLASGADVVILAEDAAVEDTAAELSRRSGRPVDALQCDVTDGAALDVALAPLERVDVLVNNAGVERITPLLVDENDGAVEDTFRRILDVNVTGTFQVTRRLVDRIPARGSILITCSIWSRTAVPAFSAYCASKHATLGLVRSFAQELAPRGIRVNGVCPGWVRTETAMRSLAVMAARTGRSEEDLLAEIVSAQTLDGLLEPEDVAPTYLYLASDAAANLTGQALMADRGEVMA